MKRIYNKNAREKTLLEEAYSNVYKENIDGERWSEEYDIKEVTDTDDLEYANRGDAFLFDKVAEYAQAEEEVIEKESDVMDFLSRFGEWELKDNAYGAIVVKTGEAHNEMQPPLSWNSETGAWEEYLPLQRTR
jgi:antirestriction protein